MSNPESDRTTTSFPSDLFTDRRLSFAAKGILALIHTYEDRRGLTIEALAGHSRDGISAVRNTLRELETLGYLRRVRGRRANGTMGPSTYLLPGDTIDAPLDGSGYAYAIADRSNTFVKIGCSRNVRERLAGLQTSWPGELSVIWMGPGGRAVESHLHEVFAGRRVRGEWFDFAGVNAIELIRRAAETFGGPQ